MITIPLIIIVTLLGYFFSSKIRKNSLPIYLAFSVISIVAYFVRDFPGFLPFYKGFLGLAIFYVVMMIGILGKKTKIYKRLYSIRAELSIIGFIILTPHAIFFIINKLFFTGKFEWIGLIAYIIMVPLFITSFTKIRNKFKFYEWKIIQNFAYIVYMLIFVHLIISASITINLILYIVLFTPYILYKPIHYLKNEKAFYKKVKSNYKATGKYVKGVKIKKITKK